MFLLHRMCSRITGKLLIFIYPNRYGTCQFSCFFLGINKICSKRSWAQRAILRRILLWILITHLFQDSVRVDQLLFFYVFPRSFCKNVFSLKERAEKSRGAAYFASLIYQGVYIWGLEEQSISEGGVSGDWLVEVNTEDEDNYQRWEEDGKFKYRFIYIFENLLSVSVI